ncbi:hypothetical protein D9613_011276 [Agrocybe pediades]|uniref:Uncharacterized protein n=1 Tax=Agrocybe pediades TaxID=84607 RepID=A0A8H4QRD5_9AGAR|nr:hypothetical protein D9613_011276 [Agrocybe pediades]
MADKDPSRRAEHQHQRAPSLNSRQPYPESRAPSQEQSNGQSNGAVHLRTLHPVYPDNRIPPPPGAQYVQVHGRRPSIPSMPPEGHGPIPSSVAPFIDPNGSRRPVHLSARQASAPSLIIPAVQPSQRLHFQYDSPTYSLPTPPATAQQQQQQPQQQQQAQQQQNARPLPPQAPMHTLAPAPAPAHAGPSRTMESIVDHALVPVRARLEDVLQATKETLHENLMKIREDYGVYLNDMQTRHERATQATLEKKEAGYKLAVEEVNRLQREVAELRKARDNDAHIIEGYRRRDSEKELNDGHSMVLLAAKYIDELSEEYKKVFREKERLRREITNGTPGSTSSALGDDDILKSFSDERDRSRLQKLRHILRLAESQQNGERPSSSNPHSRRPSMSSPQLLANVPALSRNGQSPFVNGESAPKERPRSSTYSPAIWKPAPPEENAHIRPQHSPIDGNSPHEFSTAPSRPSVGRSASTSRILPRHSPIDDDSSPRDFSTRPGAVVRSASSILSQHSPMDENPPPPREFNARPFLGARPGSSSSRSNSSPALPQQTYRDTPIIPGSMPPPLSTHPRDSRKRPRESSLEIGGASTPVDERPAIRIKTEERQPSEALVSASPSPMQVDSNVKLESRPAQLEKEGPWTREGRGPAHDQQPQPHERRREASREVERRHGHDERTQPPPPREVRGPAPEPQPHAHERHREASREEEEEERRLSRHDERKQPPPLSEVPRSASAPTAASTPVQPQAQAQPPRLSRAPSQEKAPAATAAASNPPRPKEGETQEERLERLEAAVAHFTAKEAGKAQDAAAPPRSAASAPPSQPAAAAATAPPPPPSQASAPAPPPPPAHAPMQPTQPPAQMPAYYRSDVYKPVPEIQRLAYRRPSGGSSSYFPPPPRAPPPVFAASSEPPPPAGPPKLGLKHLDLMYKQDNAGYTCQYCINRARNRSPTSSPGKAPPTPIAKFPKTAPMQDLMNHSLKEHPQECDNLLKLNHTQITERKQRMRAGGM